MANKISPLAPDAFPTLPPMAGLRFATTSCGIRKDSRDDVMLAVIDPTGTIAGVTTKSRTSSAPVLWCREHLPKGRVRAIIMNSGNSNAFTGRAGEAFLAATITATAKAVGCRPEEVFAASTGVIGQPMVADQIARHLDRLLPEAVSDGWERAARAIMTTDTFPKGATRRFSANGRTLTVSGIAKGSGMIAPDMATMLAMAATDAVIAPQDLDRLTRKAVAASFNAITVDGDTSTSDTLLVAATGAAGGPPLTGRGLGAFARALNEVLLDLALQVVRDGEGASKLVRVNVTGATSTQAAHRIAMAIANSPLVKTAIAGEDANWGRIVMAVGKSGQEAERDRLQIKIGGIVIAANGGAVEGYDEAPVARHMQGQEIDISVDIGLGRGQAVVWTCDLTHGYIDINGSYRS